MGKVLIFIILTLSSISIIAQPGGGGPGGDPDVPIHGLFYLLLAGLILGIKKIMAKNKST